MFHATFSIAHISRCEKGIIHSYWNPARSVLGLCRAFSYSYSTYIKLLNSRIISASFSATQPRNTETMMNRSIETKAKRTPTLQIINIYQLLKKRRLPFSMKSASPSVSFHRWIRNHSPCWCAINYRTPYLFRMRQIKCDLRLSKLSP